MATKLTCALAGFGAGVVTYYFVRERVWDRAEGVAAHLEEIQRDVPAIQPRSVAVRTHSTPRVCITGRERRVGVMTIHVCGCCSQVKRPELLEQEQQLARNLHSEALGWWNSSMLTARKLFIDNVLSEESKQ